jgi:hypothetical protein
MRYAMLHLDPCDPRPEMFAHRVGVYTQLFVALSRAGYSVSIFLPRRYASRVQDLLPQALIVASSYETSININEYYSLAMQNSLNINKFDGLLTEYKELGVRFDVIITNTPSSLLRTVYEDTLILHYELGIFNRRPFQEYHQFDPFGYSWKSLLCKFPIVFPGISEIFKSRKFGGFSTGDSREQLLQQSGLLGKQIGSIDAIYFPIPSGTTWSSLAEVSCATRTKYLKMVAMRYANYKVLTNEKPQYPLSEEEWSEVRELKNVQIVKNKDQMGDGSLLAMLCAKTYTFSPSMGLQTLFWGNKLLTHEDSSMLAWSSKLVDREMLMMYLDNFHLRDLTLVPNYLELWQQINPYNPHTTMFL